MRRFVIIIVAAAWALLGTTMYALAAPQAIPASPVTLAAGSLPTMAASATVTDTVPADAVTVQSARRVSDIINERQPVFTTLSPDGQFIAWYRESGRGRSREQQVCVFTFVNADKRCHTLPAGEFGGFPYQLQWSPDSTQIAFSENPVELGHESDIWVLSAADGAFTNVTEDGLTGSWRTLANQENATVNLDYLPAWNPADGAIYFWRVQPQGNLNFGLTLQRIDPNGGDAEEVADVGAALPGTLPIFDFQSIYLDGPSAVAPDGSKLAAILGTFNPMGSTQFGLYLFDITAADVAPVEAIGPDAWSDAIPAWQSMPAQPIGLAWTDDSANVVAGANSTSAWTPFMVFYNVDAASGEKQAIVDFSSVESTEAYFASAPGREIPWRFFSPWTAALAPTGDRLLLLNNLGGVLGLLVSSLPPTGELPPLVQTADSWFTSTMTQSSRSSNGMVLMYGLLLTLEQPE
jgi:hypothetical protein